MSVWAKTWAYKQHPKRVEGDKVTDKKHAAAKAVLVALAEYPGPGERHCWPSQKTLADMTDMTDRQVRRCMADLESQGLIHRKEERRKDGTRKSDTITLLGPIEDFGPQSQPDERSGRAAYQPDESNTSTGRERPEQPDDSSGHEPSVGTASEPDSVEKTSFSTGEAAEQSSDGPPKDEVKPQDPKQYGVAQLMERVSAARERGASLHSPTNDERKDFGKQFAQCFKDGYGMDTLLAAFDYQVTKAAGEIEGEPKAWCGYRTALDRVNEGWRPAGLGTPATDPEQQALAAQNRRDALKLIYGDDVPDEIGKTG